VDAERRRLSLSLKRIDGGGVTEHADDAEAVEGTPNIGLSEEVFPENGEPQAEVVDEAPAEVPETPETPEPQAEEAPDAEADPDAPAVTPAPDELDASIEADQASPEEQGPGDSEGGPPAPPD
jgi:hypothetical protein